MRKPATDASEAAGFITASRTHVGLVRAINEDRVLAQPQIGLWAIADGMGGHSLGDRAATAVVSALSAIGPQFPSEDVIGSAIQSANATIFKTGQSARVVCGSTVAGLAISGGAAFVFWIGDSRVYRLRGKHLTRLTTDHSVVQELRDAGVLTEQQMRSDPRNNIITRAVGIQPEVMADFASVDVQQDDLFLICSDGLSDLIDDKNIIDLLRSEKIEESADELIRASLAAGGFDNISLIIVAPNLILSGPCRDK
jgi:serine/threonine protein phosphatase PrpC